MIVQDDLTSEVLNMYVLHYMIDEYKFKILVLDYLLYKFQNSTIF